MVIVRATPSHASDLLCQIWKEYIQNCKRYKADTACVTDGQTDRHTEWVKPIYTTPQQLRYAGVHNNEYW